MLVPISPVQARRIALLSQGLWGKSPFANRKQGVVQAISHLGYLQIDTISVIARAHHHTLWSRIPAYKPSMIYDIQEKDQTIFEYWSHAAAFLPIEDFRFSLPRKHDFLNGKKHWFEKDDRTRKYVLDRIQAEGPLQSKDFQTPKGANREWYFWKPAKIALEQLFQEGKLMVARRQGFQKVFDLTERVLPDKVDTHYPTEEEMAMHLIVSSIRARGFSSDSEISYLRRGWKKPVQKAIKSLVEEKAIVPIRIKGIEKQVYYTFPDYLEKIPIGLRKKKIHLLSPFDNLVIQRNWLGQVFGFDYQIECYVPQPKRKYGYFSLPILYGDQFIGRLDPKADRKSRILHIKKLWLEKGFKDFDPVVGPFAEKLWSFAHFNGCEEIKVEWCNSGEFLRELKAVLDKKA